MERAMGIEPTARAEKKKPSTARLRVFHLVGPQGLEPWTKGFGFV